MIKAIFFDAAGILYTRTGPTAEYAIDVLQKRGFSTPLSSEQNSYLEGLRSQASQGILNYEHYWDQFLLLRGVEDAHLRKELSADILRYSNDVLPVSGNREALTGLKQKGFLLGIITDTMYPLEWKMRRLKKAGVADLLDIVACSTELGVHKPDPAIYSFALQQAQLKEGETAFVGHLGVELDGARKAGMVTIAIDQDVDARADYYCGSLLDLLTLPVLQSCEIR